MDEWNGNIVMRKRAEGRLLRDRVQGRFNSHAALQEAPSPGLTSSLTTWAHGELRLACITVLNSSMLLRKDFRGASSQSCS